MSNNDIPLWNEVPYAGEDFSPSNPEAPYTSSWPTFYIKREGSNFSTRDGEAIHFNILSPDRIHWETELKKVKSTLANLTEREKTIATYWSRGPATKQWTPIADKLIDSFGVEAPRAARILSILYAGLNDAFVATWYYKFEWNVARPNQLDPTLKTYICTPRHPSYPSGHAAIAGAAEVILGYFFPSMRRRLHELAEECAASRLYAGVHFPVDNSEGLKLGREVGQIVIEEIRNNRDESRGIIDIPLSSRRPVDLLPPPYEQSIPFDFDNACESLTTTNSAPHFRRGYRGTKPKLFF
ncbi:vanadium-dependent haloperoxidase [Bacillus sp. 2205SS5-2]|uniref:vanadium-dependent haloperoxidase n=1 Tax=Bacillus sp. 2205SS5-2 TaxID=3109031 RepID=UPI0030057FB7